MGILLGGSLLYLQWKYVCDSCSTPGTSESRISDNRLHMYCSCIVFEPDERDERRLDNPAHADTWLKDTNIRALQTNVGSLRPWKSRDIDNHLNSVH